MPEVRTTKACRRRRTRAELAAVDLALPEPGADFLAKLTEDEFAEYIRRKRALKLYREGADAGTLLKSVGMKIGDARLLLNRAMRTDLKTGLPLGIWACVPNRMPTSVVHQRRTPFNQEAAGEGQGLKGALSVFFLQHPDIKRDLDAFLRTRRLQGAAPETCISSSRCLANFYKLCRLKDLHHKEDKWPFHTKRRGANAVRDYYRRWKIANPLLATLNEHGEDAAQVHRVDLAVANRVGEPTTPIPFAYGRVELDEHLLHACGLVTFPTKSGIDAHVEVRRVYALVLREYRSDAILAAIISYGGRYDMNDVLRLVRKALFPPKRFQLTLDAPEFGYREGAAYPAELKSFAANCWQVLALDADTTHIAAAETELLKRLLRCKVAGERIGCATARHSAEGGFVSLAEAFEVLSSGTGSNPRSPARRDPEGAARKFGIKVEHMEEMLDVWCRNKNASFSPTLGASPLEALEELALKGEVVFNKLGELGDPAMKHEFYPRFQRTFRLSRKSTGVLLVNLFGAKYSGPDLAGNRMLLSTSDMRCTIYVKDEDARFAIIIPHAFPEMRIPVVVQNRALRNFKHTLEWRRLACAHNVNLGKADKAVKPDTMRAALDYYGQQALNKVPGAEVSVSKISGAMAQETLGSASTLDMDSEWSEALMAVLDEDEAETADSEDDSDSVQKPALKQASPPSRSRATRPPQPSVDASPSSYEQFPSAGPSDDPLGLGL